MKSISIRQLHEKTGEWVRLAEAHERIVITERRQPVAALIPYRKTAKANRFRGRKVLPAFARLQGKLVGGTDSTAILRGDRDRNHKR